MEKHSTPSAAIAKLNPVYLRPALILDPFKRKTTFKALLFLAFVFFTTDGFSQTLESYLKSRGVYNLCVAAHPANDYIDGSYEMTKAYAYVSIISRDNIMGGSVYTDMQLVRGIGDLFISDIIVKKDNDPFALPFDAFGLQAALMMELCKAIDTDTYAKIRNAVQAQFHTDFEQWTGKMWAVFMLNLDYYDYAINRK